MAGTVAVQHGIDREWLRGEARRDPVAHAWAVWDLDHAPDRVRFLTIQEGGRPVAYLLLWFGLPTAPVVHWVGVPDDPQPLLNALPPRPLIAIVPTLFAQAVVRARTPATAYPLLVLAANPQLSLVLGGIPPAVRRLTGSDRSELAEFARNHPSMLTAAYLAIDPAHEPVWGAFADGKLIGVARAQVTLPRVWMIGGIYTVPDRRGQGMGRALTAAATRAAIEARATAALVVREDNAPARHIYESLGYRIVDRRVWVDAGVDYSP